MAVRRRPHQPHPADHRVDPCAQGRAGPPRAARTRHDGAPDAQGGRRHGLARPDHARTLAGGRAKLWLDGRKEFTLEESVEQIGAPHAWQQGWAGKGVTVAVLDSGYDAAHPDLKGAVVQERNFSGDPDISDPFGHGTHVASIVASRGEKYRGVAPGASPAIGKVGGRSGMTDSTVLAGMEWAALEVKAKVVNLSLGAVDGVELDLVEQAVNTPAGSGAYTLTASLSRTSQTLSTGVASVWTFRSMTGQGALPLMAVRYRPDGLDRSNRAA
ncbi:S8 family peptidase [Nonomuraea sp. NPDC050328]|uniref:S8 family peptidase n=1 Tax=Nonomuraea sp. NPDC050328 TaxID=3364361 RepID=UPI0037B0E48A